MSQPDLLVFMSDQHTASIAGHAGDPYVQTPHLDTLAKEGTVYKNTYTSCPLCVPARMSMLTSLYPSQTGIFSNNSVLSSDQPTFAHTLAAAGYETVLCGRMHFMGPDQHHGFTKRLVGDFTPTTHGRGGDDRKDLGPFVNTASYQFDKLYGGGTSPVLGFDRAVIDKALEVIETQTDKPLLLVVGTYGPHPPYVCAEDLYKKYQDVLPEPEPNAYTAHPVFSRQQRTIPKDQAHKLRAAYYGMVETMDGQIGEIRAAWQRRLEKSKNQGVFMYTSDHGDHLGTHDFWGKRTFYEASAKIPLMISGPGFEQGKTVTGPANIMDIGPTLNALGGAAKLPGAQGLDLANEAEISENRAVMSELLLGGPHHLAPARMVRLGPWKYVYYHGHENPAQLFNLETDPKENTNVVEQEPKTAKDLHALCMENWHPEKILEDQAAQKEKQRILTAWGQNTDTDEPFRWPIPPQHIQEPKA